VLVLPGIFSLFIVYSLFAYKVSNNNIKYLPVIAYI
jgi:hypothetical protein